ncbi:bacterial regulatory s, gntR family protein [Clostridium argentinense CDC 2741]|uniref:Bacterial regulatory s, gntR family protein n=1 Tax=Clostridium argentinense CDC 2741 TaxID=1418104 RepID=A0A0C1QVI0_9CLOT|nr:FadR/GntR family transcriptional regulator [Clostridium argentinense]ARC84294.1 GntR family transcriptional regulator [Clostridium argentinense]KIE44977.1 bacterial regulatory s, gntR family protein [Clostridium argentinense CDC 2741]NFF38255.1 FadR family transcriptional regulator [Clostridium argentinense]NFP49160.1 FadR family transcriptional regulator [Clostridium argentinense]NFP71560.1 FadR family transcriptional regulator [Clostridium argentinense]
MFSPIKNTRVYEKVIEQIKEMIVKGTFKKGDKLPSEREMAESLQISRTSIREALRELEIMGLIESRQGEGNFIKNSFENNLLEPLSTIFLLKESNPDEILELRNIIERGSVALAAERITDAELTEMELLLEDSLKSDFKDKLVDMDINFHYKIAQASKNFLILSILNAISFLIEAFIKDIRKNVITKEENINMLIQQHRDILSALKAHDPIAAEKAMLDHLQYVNSQMKKEIEIIP